MFPSVKSRTSATGGNIARTHRPSFFGLKGEMADEEGLGLREYTKGCRDCDPAHVDSGCRACAALGA